jgi:hypothetical protein
MGEGAISGSGYDVIFQKPDGSWSLPGPDPTLWPWIFGLIVIQAGLIVAIIRLRDPKKIQRIVF